MLINQLTDSGEVTSKRECWGFRWQYHTILFNERLRQRIVHLLFCVNAVPIFIIIVERIKGFICCGDSKPETHDCMVEPLWWQQTGDLWMTFWTFVVTANLRLMTGRTILVMTTWRLTNNFLNYCGQSKLETCEQLLELLIVLTVSVSLHCKHTCWDTI